MKLNKSKNSALFCSICEETTEELKIQGIKCIRLPHPSFPNNSTKHVTICSNCVKSMHNQINPNETTSSLPKPTKAKQAIIHEEIIEEPKKIITPRFLYNILSQSVIGQERAKRAISLAVATHLRRIENPSIEKSNILLLGPTGSGKTEMARTVAKRLNLPLVIADATTFTAHGYVGEDVESILISLLQNAGGKVELAERGIVFIDEIDKIAQKINEHSVNSSSVQQSLLKMIEGGKVRIPKTGLRKDVGNEMVVIDTSKILFICSGAFGGLEQIVKESLNKEKNSKKSSKIAENIINISDIMVPKNNQPIFNLEDINTKELDLLYYNEKDPFEHVNERNLLDFGIISELLGRLPIITSTAHLTKEALLQILSEPDNCLADQYKQLMNAYGVDIEYTQDFLESVAEEALSIGMGARSLRKVMEKKLEKVLFDGPDEAASKTMVISTHKTIVKKKKKVDSALNFQ